MQQLQQILPQGVNIAEAYEQGTDEQQAFVQNLALFFTGFFKVRCLVVVVVVLLLLLMVVVLPGAGGGASLVLQGPCRGPPKPLGAPVAASL
jgi:hypothetical protein